MLQQQFAIALSLGTEYSKVQFPLLISIIEQEKKAFSINLSPEQKLSKRDKSSKFFLLGSPNFH